MWRYLFHYSVNKKSVVTSCTVDPFFARYKGKGIIQFSWLFHGEKKKPYIRFYFHHNNHGEEPAGLYGENTTYIIYIIFSPYMVNVVYTIHRENKRNRKKIGKKEPCSTQKAFAFVEYGTRRCPSSSDRPVEGIGFQ